MVFHQVILLRETQEAIRVGEGADHVLPVRHLLVRGDVRVNVRELAARDEVPSLQREGLAEKVAEVFNRAGLVGLSGQGVKIHFVRHVAKSLLLRAGRTSARPFFVIYRHPPCGFFSGSVSISADLSNARGRATGLRERRTSRQRRVAARRAERPAAATALSGW